MIELPDGYPTVETPVRNDTSSGFYNGAEWLDEGRTTESFGDELAKQDMGTVGSTPDSGNMARTYDLSPK